MVISVRDNGEGIPREKQAIIFDRYRQVDTSFTRRSEGCGIGLALTKSLVEILEGRITLQSSSGTGSEFTVELPVTEREEQMEADTSGTQIDKRVQMEFSDIDFS